MKTMLQKIKDFNLSETEEAIVNAQDNIISLVRICHDNIKSMNELQKLDNYTIINSVVNIDEAIENLRKMNQRAVKQIEYFQNIVKECVEVSINAEGN